jgi:hypothetical protein
MRLRDTGDGGRSGQCGATVAAHGGRRHNLPAAGVLLARANADGVLLESSESISAITNAERTALMPGSLRASAGCTTGRLARGAPPRSPVDGDAP